MSDPLLSIRNVSKVYGDPETGLVALNDFSLTIARDTPEIVTIAGESGSGKSTLVNLVLGFTRPTKGTITFDGFDVGSASRDGLRQYHQLQHHHQSPQCNNRCFSGM